MNMLTKVFGFSGRASRAEFWSLHIVTMALQILAIVYLMIKSSSLGSSVNNGTVPLNALNMRTLIDSISINRGTLLIILAAPLWMQLSVAWRRLHDRDKPGGWAIAMLLPIFLSLFLSDISPGTVRPSDIDLLAIVAACWYFGELGILEGSPGANQYDQARVRDTTNHVQRIIEQQEAEMGTPVRDAEAAMDRAIAERRRQVAAESAAAKLNGTAFTERRVGMPDTRDVKTERRSGRDRRAGSQQPATQGFGRRSG